MHHASKGKIYLRLESGTKVNKLFFKDTGTGIAPDVLPHIFDRFFTKTENGIGIGLAFCRYAMESLQGEIICHSENGKFTEFTLTFPTLKSNCAVMKMKKSKRRKSK